MLVGDPALEVADRLDRPSVHRLAPPASTAVTVPPVRYSRDHTVRSDPVPLVLEDPTVVLCEGLLTTIVPSDPAVVLSDLVVVQVYSLAAAQAWVAQRD